MSEKPEILSATRVGDEWSFSRRGFLSATAAVLATAGLSAQGAESAVTDEEKKECGGRAHKGAINGATITPDGAVLVTCGADKFLKLWSLPNGALMSKLEGHAAPVTALAVSPDNKLLLSGDDSGVVRVWSLQTGKLDRSFKAHQRAVTAITVSQCGQHLLTGSTDCTIASRLLPEGRIEDFVLSDSPVRAIALSSDGTLCAVATKRSVKVRASPGLTGGSEWSLDAASPEGVAFNSDGSALVVADLAHGLRSWAFGAKEVKPYYPIQCSCRNSFAATADATTVAWGDGHGVGVCLLKARHHMLLSGHKADISVLAISPDGTQLFSGDSEGSGRLWELPDGAKTGCLMDLEASPAKIGDKKVKGAQYGGVDIYGRKTTFTLPCGAPIPPGAVCTCNCISAGPVPSTHKRKIGGGVCTCDLICTCNSVCSCVGNVSRGSHYWHPC